MDQYHRPYTKKVSSGTGGRKRTFKDKKASQLGGIFASTKVSETEMKVKIRRRGGSQGIRLKKSGTINVVSKGKMQKVKILRVLESHNPEYVRMNIITKGAVLETSAGKAKVTNRVGQDGIINGILLN